MSELIPADSPNRCQRTTPSGQCKNASIPGTDLCDRHTSSVAKLRHSTQSYLIDDARTREAVRGFAESDAIYSLREEIAILRVLIGGLAKGLKDDAGPLDTSLVASKVIDLMKTLEGLVKTSGTMEVKFGNMLTKDTVMKIGQAFVRIVTEEVSHIEGYDEIVDRVVSRFINEVKTSKNEEPE